MKTIFLFCLLFSAVSAKAFQGLSVTESGQSEIVQVNIDEIVDWGIHLPAETVAPEWGTPDQIRWGLSGGVRGGVAGVLRVGLE